jgi:hypothetical protein
VLRGVLGAAALVVLYYLLPLDEPWNGVSRSNHRERGRPMSSASIPAMPIRAMVRRYRPTHHHLTL